MPSALARRRISAVAGVALMAAIGVTTSAATLERASPARDCWTLIETGAEVCVDQGADLAAAVLEETGYTVLTGPDDLAGAAARGSIALRASYNLGTIFDDAGYGGGSYTFQTSNAAVCSGGNTYGTPDLRTIGWNDRLSSYQGYNGCRGVLYGDILYGGGSFGPSGSTSYVGSGYNDWASSLRWID